MPRSNAAPSLRSRRSLARILLALVASGIALVLAPAASRAAPDPKQSDAPSPSTEPTKPEKSALSRIAADWVELGKWCVSKKLGAEAKVCVEKAETADATGKSVKELKDRAASCEDGADEKDRKEYEKAKLPATGKRVAAEYEKLSAAGAAVTEPALVERFEGYLFRALEVEPTDKRWAQMLGSAEAAIGAKDAARGLRIADRALGLKPPEKLLPRFRRVGDQACTDQIVLRTATTHPIKYFFSLPQGYERKKDKKWVVLFADDGAGSNFQGIADCYKGGRGAIPFIIASPCTFGNTNQIVGNDAMMKKYRTFYPDKVIEEGDHGRTSWDEEGTLAILKDLKESYDAADQCCFTGFSGGGNLTFRMIFKHPDLLLAAAPTCGNFYGTSEGKDDHTAEQRSFPCHCFTGEKDDTGCTAQTLGALDAMKGLGYSNTKHTSVPGLGHGVPVAEVVAFLKPLVEGTQKRSDKLK